MCVTHNGCITSLAYYFNNLFYVFNVFATENCPSTASQLHIPCLNFHGQSVDGSGQALSLPCLNGMWYIWHFTGNQMECDIYDTSLGIKFLLQVPNDSHKPFKTQILFIKSILEEWLLIKGLIQISHLLHKFLSLLLFNCLDARPIPPLNNVIIIHYEIIPRLLHIVQEQYSFDSGISSFCSFCTNLISISKLFAWIEPSPCFFTHRFERFRMGSTIMQVYMKHILDSFFHVDSKVRICALEIVGLVLHQGLVASWPGHWCCYSFWLISRHTQVCSFPRVFILIGSSQQTKPSMFAQFFMAHPCKHIHASTLKAAVFN